MPTAKTDFSDPASVVTGFINTMNLWERLAAALYDNVEARFGDGSSTMSVEEMEVRKPVLEIPKHIVATFLTERKRVYAPSGSFSIPPEYDPRTEKVVRVVPKTKSQAIVETDRKASFGGGTREYVMKKQGDHWLIDSVTVTLGGKKMKMTLV